MKKSYAYGGGGLAAIVIAAILLSTSTVDPLNEQTRMSIPVSYTHLTLPTILRV